MITYNHKNDYVYQVINNTNIGRDTISVINWFCR